MNKSPLAVITKQPPAIDRVATGARIREAREKAGLTQSKLALMLRVSPPLLCDIEKGKRRITPERIAQIEAALKRR